jgi:hypothetical protein
VFVDVPVDAPVVAEYSTVVSSRNTRSPSLRTYNEVGYTKVLNECVDTLFSKLQLNPETVVADYLSVGAGARKTEKIDYSKISYKLLKRPLFGDISTRKIDGALDYYESYDSLLKDENPFTGYDRAEYVVNYGIFKFKVVLDILVGVGESRSGEPVCSFTKQFKRPAYLPVKSRVFNEVMSLNLNSNLRQVLATASSPSVSNAAVQHGPIALPNLFCARSFTQKLCPRNRPANA